MLKIDGQRPSMLGLQQTYISSIHLVVSKKKFINSKIFASLLKADTSRTRDKRCFLRSSVAHQKNSIHECYRRDSLLHFHIIASKKLINSRMKELNEVIINVTGIDSNECWFCQQVSFEWLLHLPNLLLSSTFSWLQLFKPLYTGKSGAISKQ